MLSVGDSAQYKGLPYYTGFDKNDATTVRKAMECGGYLTGVYFEQKGIIEDLMEVNKQDSLHIQNLKESAGIYMAKINEQDTIIKHWLALNALDKGENKKIKRQNKVLKIGLGATILTTILAAFLWQMMG